MKIFKYSFLEDCKEMKKVRVRFAPSPTGPLHIGGARSALFNYLYAKNNGGDFIFRIEDTDQARSTYESEVNIKDSLHWLGIDWNEGVDAGGEFEPYRQMERLATYEEAAAKLVEEGKAYYCYCTACEVHEAKEMALAAGKMPNYSGKCRTMSEEEKAERKAVGIKPVIRLKVDAGTPVEFDDLVRGHVSFERENVGDFVIMKSDGIPVYNFACVVDDHLMDITHVLRGEEHLSNTPRQVVLYEALGWEMPKFGHISLILGEDKSKMSKRNGDVSCVAYREKGYIPEALINFLALLGWSPEGEEEIFTMQDLEEKFSLDRVSKSPAVFDMNKLKWINGQYLRKLSTEELAANLAEFLTIEIATEKMPLLAETFRNQLEIFTDINNFTNLFMGTDVTPENDEAIEVLNFEETPMVLAMFRDAVSEMDEVKAADIKALLTKIRKETGLGGAKVFMPVRVGVTGCKHGPDVDKLCELMGKEILLERLNLTLGNLA